MFFLIMYQHWAETLSGIVNEVAINSFLSSSLNDFMRPLKCYQKRLIFIWEWITWIYVAYTIHHEAHINLLLLIQILFLFISECAEHCSLCFNETECYECTQGYYLTVSGECQRKYNGNVNDIAINLL